MILDHCAKDFELLSIRILRDTGGKAFTEIGLLVQALKLCSEMEADVVSLSAVSSILSDSRLLYDVTLSLSESAVIVGALDNRRFVTVPTSYPHVIGVRSDAARLLLPGELAYNAADPYNAGVYANCDFDYLRENGFSPSNSFAAPVAAAYVNGLLNRGRKKDDIDSMVLTLDPYPGIVTDEFDNYHRPVFPGREIPVVLMSGYSTRECITVMDVLTDAHEAQAAALSLADGEYDVRIRRISGVDVIKNELDFMERHYKTDIVFIVCPRESAESIRQRIEVDVELLRRSGEEVLILYDNVQETVCVSAVPGRLDDILSQSDESDASEEAFA